MKHKDFRDHELHCVQNWVRFIREGIETHLLEDSKYKEEVGEVAVEFDAHETPFHATTSEDINSLLADERRVG